MKKEITPKQTLIFHTIYSYAYSQRGYIPSKWETINYLIGYYGSVDADHVAAIHAAVREGVVGE